MVALILTLALGGNALCQPKPAQKASPEVQKLLDAANVPKLDWKEKLAKCQLAEAEADPR